MEIICLFKKQFSYEQENGPNGLANTLVHRGMLFYVERMYNCQKKRILSKP